MTDPRVHEPGGHEPAVHERAVHEPSVVRMADDIARNLPHLAGAERAQTIAAHLRSCWAPQMRSQLAQIVRDDPGSVDPAVVAAVEVLSHP